MKYCIMEWFTSFLILVFSASQIYGQSENISVKEGGLAECAFGVKLKCRGNGLIMKCNGDWNVTSLSYRHECHSGGHDVSDHMTCCTPCCDRPGTNDVYKWCEHISNEDFTCLPKDCLSIKLNGEHRSGVYLIQPDPSSEPIQAWCDMETEAGGWTVIQRRVDESVDFNRDWDDYEAGFGDPELNYWMGLKNIHLLTKHPVELYIYLEKFDEEIAFAHYNMFSVGDASSDYRLLLAGYSGTAVNEMTRDNDMRYLSGMKFSTQDRDNDLSSRDCASCCGGAWWHRDCTDSALNGRYFTRESQSNSNNQAIKWIRFCSPGEDCSLKRTTMMIRI